MTKLTTRTFTAEVPGPVVFRLEAPAANVDITVSPDAEVATAELSGPAEVTDEASAATADGQWALTLPAPHPVVTGNTTVINHDGTTVINHGGGTVITGNVMSVSGISIGSGRMQVGHVSGVTGIHVGASSATARLAVTLPTGSRLAARVDAGQIATRGELPDAEISGTAADVDIDTAGMLRVRTISGDITAAAVTGQASLHAISGDIGIDDAAGPVTARTTSGDITVRTGSPVTIDAGSVSGDITVRAASGAFPDVRARSVSGRVRTTTR